MPPKLANAAQLLGRLFLVMVFIRAGWNQFNGHDGTVAYIVKNGLPLPELAYWVSVVTMLGVSALVLLGLFTRLAALWMAGFSVVLAVAFHFQPGNGSEIVQYFKDMAIAGGFLQLFAAGAGGWSLDALLTGERDRPFQDA